MVRFAISMFPTEYAIGPVELARAVEDRGLDMLFFPEHTHIPASRKSPWPGGAELPREYSHTMDPFVILGACAAATKRLILGTGVCLVIERDPIILAKEVATLDHLANGRFIFGVGAGWNAEEMANHGTPFAQRWKILREKILAMKTIWTHDAPEFHGEFVDFDPIWSFPKPLQPGGPPIWLGSNSRWVPDRVADYGDGWIPIVGRGEGGTIAALKQACARRGRNFADIKLGVYKAPLDAGEVRALLAAGYTELMFIVPPEGRDRVLPLLDTIAELADRVRE